MGAEVLVDGIHLRAASRLHQNRYRQILTAFTGAGLYSVFSQIGINCHLCPRHACTQRAHQPVFMELSIDTARRGNTRYES